MECPQFVSSKPGVWLAISPCMDRITHNSSACCATFGNNSLTSNPHSPYLRNLNGDPKILPARFSCVGCNCFLTESGSGFPSKPIQFGLRVKRVHLRRTAIHEQMDDAFHLRREMRLRLRKR